MTPDFEQDRQAASEWAADMLQRPDVIILDSETTDFRGELVELSMIDLEGNTLYDQQFSPLLPIHPGAFKVHGLSAEKLAGKPAFETEYGVVKAILEAASVVLIYNAAFDTAIIANTCDVHALLPIDYRADCVMEMYSQFCGSWSEWHSSYTWQKLPGGDHSALGDCRATLDVLKRMAGVV